MKFETEKWQLKDRSNSSSNLPRDEIDGMTSSGAFQTSRKDIEQEVDKIQSKNRPILYTKMAVVFLTLVLSFLCTRSFQSSRRSAECIRDSVLEASQFINDKLNTDPILLRLLQVTSSMIVDFAEITVMITYIVKGTHVTFPLQLIFFYVGRGIVQGIFLFGHPQGVIWTDPGVPSLAVPYGIFSDYYFSGHCGFLTMMILENYKLGNRKLAAGISVFLPYLAFVLVATRVHYSIDIIVGVMFGIYSHVMVYSYLNPIHYVLRKLFNKNVWHKIPYFCEE